MQGDMEQSMLTYSSTSNFSPLLLQLIYSLFFQNVAKYHSLNTKI